MKLSIQDNQSTEHYLKWPLMEQYQHEVMTFYVSPQTRLFDSLYDFFEDEFNWEWLFFGGWYGGMYEVRY